MKKGMPWASPSFDARTSWIFLGVTPCWNPQAWDFVHSSSHYIILSLHLQIFLHTKLHTIFISNISVFKRYYTSGKALEQKDFLLKTQATVATPSKSSIHPKRTKKGINKKQMQIMAEICQNRPVGKDEFFRRPSVAHIKKWWTNES